MNEIIHIRIVIIFNLYNVHYIKFNILHIVIFLSTDFMRRLISTMKIILHILCLLFSIKEIQSNN